MNFLVKIKNRFLTGIFMLTAFICFRLKITYADPEMKKNPPQAIYVCNHMAIFDGFVVRTVLRKLKLYSLVTSKWYEKPWARNLLFYENCISVDTENPGTKWLKDAIAVLRQGCSINIFPEGHTSKSEEVREFKPGFLLLASMCRNIPIVPIATIGKYKFFFGERKRILVGKPFFIDMEKFGLENGKAEAYAEEIRQMIIDMKTELRENR